MIERVPDDAPKILGDPVVREARRRELEASHVGTLTEFVRELRNRMGADYEIPDFDPWDGGTAADVLYLLEAPGGRGCDAQRQPTVPRCGSAAPAIPHRRRRC